MNEIQGYCQLKNDCDCSRSMGEPSSWQGKTVRVVEFNPEGDVLVFDSTGSNMGMFEKKDYSHSFRCNEKGGVLTPTGMNSFDQSAFVFSRLRRKGGYGTIVHNIVVHVSLMKGVFTDEFLFTKEREEEQQKQKK